MKWSDFLKYTKYIAVFYGIAFVIGLVGIWAPNPERWMWTAILFFAAALAGNIALGSYHYNHKSEMRFAKATYQAQQSEGVVSITDSKELAIATDEDGRTILSPQLADLVNDVAYNAARKARGY